MIEERRRPAKWEMIVIGLVATAVWTGLGLLILASLR